MVCIKNLDQNKYTEYFGVKSGVKQGDPLSPLLFSLFINDLARDINNKHCGVKAGIDYVSILLYADNIVLMSDSSGKLQELLDCLHEWCMKWQICINANKSKVDHFRKNRIKNIAFIQDR